MMDINKKNIRKYTKEYNDQYKRIDESVEKEMKKLLEKRRYLMRKDLIKIGCWKSTRPRRHYASQENDELTVKEITQFCFSTRSEKARIKALISLKGVSWPVASVILHFAFPTKYPILDFRVLWSLDWKKPSSYNFIFWQKYCDKINKISRKYKLPIRTIEKALWKYSKEHQPLR